MLASFTTSVNSLHLCLLNLLTNSSAKVLRTEEKSGKYTFKEITIDTNSRKVTANGKEITLDVPAKIKDGRTLVPLRAISEAFECEVYWYGEDKLIDIYSPANAYSVFAEKLSETITDDEGNILIEAVAYYPVMNNPDNIPILDKITEEYKSPGGLPIMKR